MCPFNGTSCLPLYAVQHLEHNNYWPHVCFKHSLPVSGYPASILLWQLLLKLPWPTTPTALCVPSYHGRYFSALTHDLETIYRISFRLWPEFDFFLVSKCGSSFKFRPPYSALSFPSELLTQKAHLHLVSIVTFVGASCGSRSKLNRC